MTDARQAGCPTPGTTGGEGLAPRLDSYRRPFQKRRFSWETRPRSVHGVINSAGVAVGVSALSTRCWGVAGQRPGETSSWSRRSGTP